MTDFEWDPAKDAANRDKHGISFEEAIAVWLDPHRLEVPAGMDGEPRFRVIGQIEGHVFTVVCTNRSTDEYETIVRIISARLSSRYERRLYYA